MEHPDIDHIKITELYSNIDAESLMKIKQWMNHLHQVFAKLC